MGNGLTPDGIWIRVSKHSNYRMFYLIHWLTVLVAVLTRQPVRWLFHGAIFADTPQGYGHGLAFVYVMWLTVVVILYFPRRWFAGLKLLRKDWWLRYL